MSPIPDPWAPFEPAPDDPWDLRKVAHLYRRAAFGATWSELQEGLMLGPAGCVARLLHPPEPDAEDEENLAALRDGVLAAPPAERDRLKAWWLYRIVFHPDRLREKMTLFWHGHFATSNAKVRNAALMLRQNELLRRHALGTFSELLNEIVDDPAMLVWLDGAVSRKERPNENFAREFLELFTLGIGHYTEPDIRAAARAFLGWVLEDGSAYGASPSFHVDPTERDEGLKTFLGQTGPWRTNDVVRITLDQPACAEFLVRKLYRAFVDDTEGPPAELLEPLASELRDHGYNIGHVLGMVLRSRLFYGPSAYRRVIRGPVDFCAGLLRALGVPRPNLSLVALAKACAQQGQDLFYPPNVKGWDGGRHWIQSATLLARGNWASAVVWGDREAGTPPYDPLSWAERHGIAPARAIEALMDLLVQSDLSSDVRGSIIRTGCDGRPESLRRALQLLVHCPEAQLA